MKELFGRMVFNIFIDNTDDHEKNHVLLMDDAGHLDLAPAFDVVCTGQSMHFQQMRVGRAGADSTIANALSEAGSFGLSESAARPEIARIAKICDGWRRHFKAAGVYAADIEYWAQHLDSEFLRGQRRDAQTRVTVVQRSRGQRAAR